MSKDKDKEELNTLQKQLRTARHLLEKSGAVLPNKKFFDPFVNAFDEKIKDVLKDALHKQNIEDKVIEEVCKDFIDGFNKHIKAMTPFSKNKQ